MLKFVSFLLMVLTTTVLPVLVVCYIFGYDSMSELPMLVKLYILVSLIWDIYKFEKKFTKIQNELDDNA
jgi:hypothetical protein